MTRSEWLTIAYLLAGMLFVVGTTLLLIAR